jgi:hypothetical protein
MIVGEWPAGRIIKLRLSYGRKLRVRAEADRLIRKSVPTCVCSPEELAERTTSR